MSGVPGFIIRHRVWVVTAWVLIVAALCPNASRISTALAVAGNRAGYSEAAMVEHHITTEFASPFARFGVLVVTGIPGPTTPEGQALLRRISVSVGHAPNVSRVVSYLTDRDSALISPEGTIIIAGIAQGDQTNRQADDWILKIRAVTARLQDSLRTTYPKATLGWTGNAALNYDVRATTVVDAARAEHRIIPVTLVLLLIVFGSLVAAVVPILSAAAAIVISLGIAAMIALHWPLTVVVRNVVSMLGLGVGIDYALLIVSRFREAMRDGHSSSEAAELALRHGGHTVLLSASAVVVSFAALMTLPATEIRSIAIGGLLVVGTSALLATTFLPALLDLLGSRLEFGRLVRGGKPGRVGVNAVDEKPGGINAAPTIAPDGRGAWWRWGLWTAAHPWITLFIGGAPLVLLALQARHVNPQMPSGDWLPRHAESSAATRELAAMGKSGLVQEVRVLLLLPPQSPVLTPAGWDAMNRLTRALAADPRIASVRSLGSITGAEHPSQNFIAMLPADVLRSFVSHDQHETVFDVIPREGVSMAQAVEFVRSIRHLDAAQVTGLPGTRLMVGGLPAFNSEYQDLVSARQWITVALVVLGSFIALLIGFRSVLVPIKAVLLNLLSVAAALGAAVLVFQKGYGIHLLGLPGPVDGLFPAVPIIVFCVVFGLSMDYEVFLVSRVAEASRLGRDTAEAVAEGLGHTGRVITSAAAVMVVVFGAFAMSEFLLIKILGFCLAAAVVLDATLVRVAVGPALLRLAGRWNWWPRAYGASEERVESRK